MIKKSRRIMKAAK